MFHNAAVDGFAEIILEVTNTLFPQYEGKLPSLSENNKMGNDKHRCFLRGRMIFLVMYLKTHCINLNTYNFHNMFAFIMSNPSA